MLAQTLRTDGGQYTEQDLDVKKQYLVIGTQIKYQTTIGSKASLKKKKVI